MDRFALCSALVVVLTTLSCHASETTLHDGDILLQTMHSPQSEAIQLATHSRFSHVGIFYRERGQDFVYEAVGPVKATPFAKWVAQGERGHFVARRLKDTSRLSPAALAKAKRIGERFRGKPYDASFGWSDDRIYCSELVYKIYDEAFGVRVGALQKLRDFDLTHPVVKAKLQERYGAHIPLDEPVVAPGSIAESTELETILER